MTIVNVDLGLRSYEIIIKEDLLSEAGNFISQRISGKKIAIVTDENVYRLHGKQLESALIGFEVHIIVCPAGEAQKSFEGLQKILNSLFDKSFERNDTLIAFGGGVIGDLTGFAASIFKRGCKFIQIPTTLLSQVDSSVGGKTAINNKYGKNLVGSFYQPKLVLSDTNVLKTLPKRELKAGYSEVVKYALLGNYDFFNWLEKNGKKVLSCDPNTLEKAIELSCKTKARIVAEDERETGKRALLNLGHTFAHALEVEAMKSGDLLHGEAVSAGMEMAFEFSLKENLCSAKDVKRVKAHFQALGLTSIKDIIPLLKNSNKFLSFMQQDKKNDGGNITLIMVNSIGDAFIQKSTSKVSLLEYLSQLAGQKNA